MNKFLWKRLVAIFITGLLITLGIESKATPLISPIQHGGSQVFTLSSSAFQEGQEIPELYTCDGGDISPPLSWEQLPNKTQSLVLIMDDPDAPRGVWDHWILFNIPTTIDSLAEDITTNFPVGAKWGLNSWGKKNYGGPCPPSGTHRYFFKLYALDIILNLAEGVDKKKLLVTMKGHILGQATLMGKYKRNT